METEFAQSVDFRTDDLNREEEHFANKTKIDKKKIKLE